jgi:ATP-dependent helicase/nuclease subunit A
MSIHQAKGLEFPIVVLPDLARTSRSQSPLIASRPDLGLVVRPPQSGPTPGDGAGDPDARDPVWRAYLTLERIDDEQESLRLFYVAATRARDAVILSAGLGPDEPVKSTSVAMRLLDERFDRRTGACRVAPAPDDPGPPPDVRVHLMDLPAPGDETEASPPPSAVTPAPRLSISAIEELIARAGAAAEDEPEQPGSPPRYVDLDPAFDLSPRAARLDALVRSVMRDPKWRRREAPALEALATRAGARQIPAASPGLVRDAVRRLEILWGLSAFRALRAASSGPEVDVRDDLEFTLVPGANNHGRSTVFHGAGDLAFRDREGRWNLIVIAESHACPARHRLRLQLAATAARARGLDPIARGWLVRHGPDGAAHEEVVTELGDREIARAVDELMMWGGHR